MTSGTYIEKCTALPLIFVQILFLAIATSGMYEEMGPLQFKVFQTSFDLRVPCFNVETLQPPLRHQPPTGLLVAVPTQSGKYPVVIFQHGFVLANCFYTQIIKHVASYGYIVVAPQVVTLNSNATQEIEDVAKVVNWLPGNLSAVMPTAVTPDLGKLVLAGHSKGAKVAFALALGRVSNTTLNFSGLVALDPVDGPGEPSPPPIVTKHCDLQFPTLILGTGYGSQKLWGIVPPCAPKCCGHQAFYNCSAYNRSPAPIVYHFVAPYFGHLDFLDDGITPADLFSWICKSGVSRAPLRNFTGGLFVAFLRSAVNGNRELMDDILSNWENESIKLEQPQIYTGPPAAVALSLL